MMNTKLVDEISDIQRKSSKTDLGEASIDVGQASTLHRGSAMNPTKGTHADLTQRHR